MQFKDDSDEEEREEDLKFFPINRDIYYTAISELPIDINTVYEIRLFLNEIHEEKLRSINVKLLSVAYICLTRNSMKIDDNTKRLLDISYNLISPWCAKESKESVKRSILRYCIFILAIRNK